MRCADANYTLGTLEVNFVFGGSVLLPQVFVLEVFTVETAPATIEPERNRLSQLHHNY